MRDSYGYSEQSLIVPPLLAHCLQFFDGEHSELDIHEELVRLTGDLQSGGRWPTISSKRCTTADSWKTKSTADSRKRNIAPSPTRPCGNPRTPGADYPKRRGADRRASGVAGPAGGNQTDGLLGIAAPHVSPAGGYDPYRSAYETLGHQERDRTFIVLGTSHYGAPEKFGLTRKNYRTPWGDAHTDLALVEELHGARLPGHLEEDFSMPEHSVRSSGGLFAISSSGRNVKIRPSCAARLPKACIRAVKPKKTRASSASSLR